MWLFLVAGPPLVLAILVTVSNDYSFHTVVKPLLKGIGIWIPAYIIYLFIDSSIQLDFSPDRIFLYYQLHHTTYWMVFGIIGYLITSYKSFEPHAQDHLVGAASFMLGIFLLQSVVDLIEAHRILNAYYLFLVPTMRIIMIVGFASLVGIFRGLSPLLQIVSFVGSLATAILASLIPLFYIWSFAFVAYVLCFFLSVCVAVLFAFAHHATRT